ncbi:unnamed protein product [Protopolystoma xenopodis]|uniref:Uncharacterized protein n=1 Tax=Protopolystoma xenopodis TaxID=117903 RepID=A0A3S5AMZ3_9PLAT|nr:unnamed protein product [Protopolystoma xenopodis]
MIINFDDADDIDDANGYSDDEDEGEGDAEEAKADECGPMDKWLHARRLSSMGDELNGNEVGKDSRKNKEVDNGDDNLSNPLSGVESGEGLGSEHDKPNSVEENSNEVTLSMDSEPYTEVCITGTFHIPLFYSNVFDHPIYLPLDKVLGRLKWCKD